MEKTSGGAVRFAGYASVFDHADRSGDIVRKGAFARAVAAGPNDVPLLWQHDPKRHIGRIERIEEDARGLRVLGRPSGPRGTARDAAAFVKEVQIDGLSFGNSVTTSNRQRALTVHSDFRPSHNPVWPFPLPP